MYEETYRIARHYGLPPQLAKLLRALILEDCLSPEKIHKHLGTVAVRSLVFKLRKRLPTLTIQQQYCVGYWLPDTLRISLAIENGIELPMPTLARMTRERRIAEGVVEYLERDDGDKTLSGRALHQAL